MFISISIRINNIEKRIINSYVIFTNNKSWYFRIFRNMLNYVL